MVGLLLSVPGLYTSKKDTRVWCGGIVGRNTPNQPELEKLFCLGMNAGQQTSSTESEVWHRPSVIYMECTTSFTAVEVNPIMRKESVEVLYLFWG